RSCARPDARVRRTIREAHAPGARRRDREALLLGPVRTDRGSPVASYPSSSFVPSLWWPVQADRKPLAGGASLDEALVGMDGPPERPGRSGGPPASRRSVTLATIPGCRITAGDLAFGRRGPSPREAR